jgi:hypothetical protein
VPTDVLLSNEERRLARKREAADLRAYLCLIPMIACLACILLCVQSRAFEAEVVFMGSLEPADLGAP